MLKTLLTSLVLPLLMTHADASTLAAEETRSRSAFEQLEGFDAIVITCARRSAEGWSYLQHARRVLARDLAPQCVSLILLCRQQAGASALATTCRATTSTVFTRISWRTSYMYVERVAHQSRTTLVRSGPRIRAHASQ